MSFSLYVAAPDAPPFSAVVDAVAEPAWACDEDAPEGDRWPPGYCFHPFVRGRSARGIEVCLDGGRFQIRVMTCSSRADYELATKLAASLARLTGNPVEPENGEPLGLDAFAQAYGDAWIDKMVTWGADMVMAVVDRDGKTLTLSGARREVHIGPRFVTELRARAGDMTPGQQLVEAIVRIQNIDETAYFPAPAFRVTPEDRARQESFTMAVWAPGIAYLMPGVEFFAVRCEDGEVLVPHDAAPSIARHGDEPRWTWLDERNALVEATSQEEWDELVARARAFSAHSFHA